MAAISVQAGNAALAPLNPPYISNTSPHGSSTGTGSDEPYIDSMSSSPVPPYNPNHAGPQMPLQNDGGMQRITNTGRRASSPAALYQPGQMISFGPAGHFAHGGNGYSSQPVAGPYDGSGLPQTRPYPYDRPPLQNHSMSHTVGPSTSMWNHGIPPMPPRAAQNGMNASSFRRGSLGGERTQPLEQGVSGYGNNQTQASLDFHHQFHHSTMYDTYQVKHRKRTSPEQLSVLEKSFDVNCKPSAVTRKQLADQIGMTPRSVQVWFQNRRQKRKMLERKKAEDGEGEDSEPVPQGYPAMLHIRGDQDMRGPGHHLDDVKPTELEGWSSRYPVYNSSDQINSEHGTAMSKAPAYDAGSSRNSFTHGYTHVPVPLAQTHARNGMPTVSGRRGSLPYPPPIATNGGSKLASPGDRPVKSQIPMHLAMSLGGRRASLPVNSRSFSLGSFTPPRTGGPSPRQAMLGKRELSPIVDQDGPQPFDTSLLSNFSPEGPQGQADIMGPGNGPLSVPGPLPNPSFSFGFNDPNASFNLGNVNEFALPLMTPFADHQGLPFANYMYRNRIGSIASMFSQDTTDSTADTIGEYPYGGNFDEGGPRILQPDEHLVLPIDFDASVRRASAPADLLQKVNLSDNKKRHSPLNPSVNFTQNHHVVPNEEVPEAHTARSSEHSAHLSLIGSSLVSSDSKQPYIYPLTALHDHGSLQGNGLGTGFDEVAFRDQIVPTGAYQQLGLDASEPWTGIWQQS